MINNLCDFFRKAPENMQSPKSQFYFAVVVAHTDRSGTIFKSAFIQTNQTHKMYTWDVFSVQFHLFSLYIAPVYSVVWMSTWL